MQNIYLVHHGILGMKWGVRRYQNEDGSLTPAGKKKYGANESDSSVTKKVKKDLSTLTGEEFKRKYQVSNTRYMKRVDKYIDPYMNSPLAKFGKKAEKAAQIKRVKTMVIKSAAVAAAIAAGTIGVKAILKKNGYSGIVKDTVSIMTNDEIINIGKKILGA